MAAILRYAGYPVTPWRNGGGVLRSIVEGDGWQVRLADIDASVPFSDYRGYLRHFAIAAGAVVLQFPSGEAVACDPDSAVAVYPGGPAPYCELVGPPPALAFNLIVEPDRVSGAIERVRVGRDRVRVGPEGGRIVAVLVQSGCIRAPDLTGSAVADRLDTLTDLPAAGVDLVAATGEAVVLVARATSR